MKIRNSFSRSLVVFFLGVFFSANTALANWWNEPVPTEIDRAATILSMPAATLEGFIEETRKEPLEGAEATLAGRKFAVMFHSALTMVQAVDQELQTPGLSPKQKADLEIRKQDFQEQGREALAWAFAFGYTTKARVSDVGQLRIVMWGSLGLVAIGRLAYELGLTQDFVTAVSIGAATLAAGTVYIAYSEISKLVDPFTRGNKFFKAFLSELESKKQKMSVFRPLKSLCEALLR
ncbi:MAG: hypothetical protein AB1540_01630 [Bdellovibrionota bacterium]